MNTNNGNDHPAEDFEKYLVPIDLSAGFIDKPFPDDTEIHIEEPRRLVCIRHHDPRFKTKSWCGASLADEAHAFPSLDVAIYVISGNADFRDERDEVCKACVRTIRAVLTQGIIVYVDGEADPPTDPSRPDNILSGGLVPGQRAADSDVE